MSASMSACVSEYASTYCFTASRSAASSCVAASAIAASVTRTSDASLSSSKSRPAALPPRRTMSVSFRLVGGVSAPTAACLSRCRVPRPTGIAMSSMALVLTRGLSVDVSTAVKAASMAPNASSSSSSFLSARVCVFPFNLTSLSNASSASPTSSTSLSSSSSSTSSSSPSSSSTSSPSTSPSASPSSPSSSSAPWTSAAVPSPLSCVLDVVLLSFLAEPTASNRA
mmetsp:Transcript_1407/g.4426  ORF Transcript_1407/g.4426 Transcript_1407/m.4426 type:complete len:226 (-) Transcript_1407:2604-3281(-)